jgi:hypothetical protein
MSRHRVSIGFVLTASIVLLAAGWALSGPLLPKPSRQLPGSWESLANISRIRLVIFDMSAELKRKDITADAVKKDWQQKLLDAGFKIASEKDLPSLELSVVAATDEAMEGNVLVIQTLVFQQTAHFERLGRDLVVPTYSHAISTMEPAQKVPPVINRNLATLINTFIERAALASRAGS